MAGVTTLACASMTAVALLGVISTAHAQTFPIKPVRIIVAFPPGGGTDIVARLMAPKLAETWGGQQAIVESRGCFPRAARCARSHPEHGRGCDRQSARTICCIHAGGDREVGEGREAGEHPRGVDGDSQSAG